MEWDHPAHPHPDGGPSLIFLPWGLGPEARARGPRPGTGAQALDPDPKARANNLNKSMGGRVRIEKTGKQFCQTPSPVNFF